MYKNYKLIKNIALGGAAICITLAFLINSITGEKTPLLLWLSVGTLVLSVACFLAVWGLERHYHIDVFCDLFDPRVVDGEEIELNINFKKIFNDDICMDALLPKIMENYPQYITQNEITNELISVDFDNLLTQKDFHELVATSCMEAYMKEVSQKES